MRLELLRNETIVKWLASFEKLYRGVYEKMVVFWECDHEILTLYNVYTGLKWICSQTSASLGSQEGRFFYTTAATLKFL